MSGLKLRLTEAENDGEAYKVYVNPYEVNAVTPYIGIQTELPGYVGEGPGDRGTAVRAEACCERVAHHLLYLCVFRYWFVLPSVVVGDGQSSYVSVIYSLLKSHKAYGSNTKKPQAKANV